MFITVVIQNQTQAPQTRRKLRKLGFSYVRRLQWWAIMLGDDPSQHHNKLRELSPLQGIAAKSYTPEEYHAIIDAKINP